MNGLDGCFEDPVDLKGGPFSGCFHLLVVVVFYLNRL